MPASSKLYLTKASSDRLDRILAAASNLLQKGGLDALTMRDLARDSGVSPVTLYNRFGGKDHIVSLIVMKSFERNVDLEDAQLRKGGSPFDHLLTLIGRLEHELRDKRAFAQALMVLHFKHDGDREIANTVYGMLRKRVHEVIRDMALMGELLPWAPAERISNELSDRILGTSFRWALSEIADGGLLAALRFSVLASLHVFVVPKLRTTIETELSSVSASRPKRPRKGSAEH